MVDPARLLNGLLERYLPDALRLPTLVLNGWLERYLPDALMLPTAFPTFFLPTTSFCLDALFRIGWPDTSPSHAFSARFEPLTCPELKVPEYARSLDDFLRPA